MPSLKTDVRWLRRTGTYAFYLLAVLTIVVASDTPLAHDLFQVLF